MNKLQKPERQKQLEKIIDDNPFLTDRELAEHFNVSVQTIRLDRLELGIPEVRERTKNVAHSAYQRLKSVNEGEVIGELIKLKLDKYAKSYLVTNEEMALQKSRIIRGHHTFAQANSLAVAVIDAEIALTGSVEIRFHEPVYVDERLEAEAMVKSITSNKYSIKVKTYKEEKLVFSGDFIMFAQSNGRGLS